MTQRLPSPPPAPVVVPWDRAALASLLRARTRTALGAVAASVAIAAASALLVPVVEGSVMAVVARGNTVLGAVAAVWNLLLVTVPVLVARRGLRTLPDDAIVVGPAGLALTLPGRATAITVPWESVHGVQMVKPDCLSVRTARGAAPRRVIAFPTKALRVAPHTVLAAAAHWSGGKVGTPSPWPSAHVPAPPITA